MAEYPFELTTSDKFLETRTTHNVEKRQQIHQEFPHVVTIVGNYQELDFVTLWCWHHFDPYHGPCIEQGSDFPTCTDKTPNHEHKGTWKIYFLGKTGYDYGFMEYCFAQAEEAEELREQFPNIYRSFNAFWDIRKEE